MTMRLLRVACLICKGVPCRRPANWVRRDQPTQDGPRVFPMTGDRKALGYLQAGGVLVGRLRRGEVAGHARDHMAGLFLPNAPVSLDQEGD